MEKIGDERSDGEKERLFEYVGEEESQKRNTKASESSGDRKRVCRQRAGDGRKRCAEKLERITNDSGLGR